MARFFLKACNAIVNMVVILALLLSGTYAVYALWDNNQVLTAAENVQADMLNLKPQVEENGEVIDTGPTFDELLAVNPDVVAWVSMDETAIDHPVLIGENNLEYINKDVYGNFALAGSIYLDSRNDRSFSDAYSLLYGHHMADSRMFGDLDRYKDEAFFRENRTGKLITPQGVYELEILSCMLVGASDQFIFEPTSTRDDIEGLLDYTEKESQFLNEDVLERARQTEDLQILALTTCASEFTDARTIVLTVMEPVAGS